ncbi:MAG: type II secretion system F family protein [Lentisphaerae bacterium]|nr:type II secretion system F family protein [Lentisphaerota bacterium]
MATFSYTAKNEGGEVVRATLKADSRHAALGLLRGRGLIPLSVEETGRGRARGQSKTRGSFTRWGGTVSVSDRSIFCRQLAISVSAGVPLRESLESITEDLEKPTFKRVLEHVVDQLHAGVAFSDALAQHPATFNKLFVALIRAAEESGSLPQTLEQLAEAQERSQRLRTKIRSITAYPTFIAVFFVVVCVVMTLFILPKFQEIFSGYDSELPGITLFVFGLNRFMIDNILWIGGGIALAVIAGVIWGRTAAGRFMNDGLKLKLPFFGSCFLKFAVSRFCQNFAVMLKGGVPVATAMEMSAATCGNRVIEKALMEARERIINGSGISESLDRDVRLPRLVVRMVSVGESSGRLPEVLERISIVYEEQVEAAVMVATSLFEPLVICLFGIVVLVLVMAVYLPVFSAAAHTG